MAKKKTPIDPNQPLMDAVKAGDAHAVMRILDAGTDTDVVLSPALRMTPLDFALGYEHPELAQALLDRGAKPTDRTQLALRSSTPENLFARVGVSDDVTTLMAQLKLFETTAAGRQALVTRYVKHGLKLSQTSLYWMIIGMDRTDEAEVAWAVDLHANVKIDVNSTPKAQSEASLMELAITDLPIAIMKRFVEMGGTIAPGRKVSADVEDSAAKKKWLAAQHPRGHAKSGLDLFGHLTDEELTDDLIVATIVGKTEVFPDRSAWIVWDGDAADTRAHLLDHHGDGLRYEFFINSEADWNEAVASSKQLYTRLYTELTKLYGKTKKGKKHSDWDAAGVHLELRESSENPYGPFSDHWTGVAVQLDAM